MSTGSKIATAMVALMIVAAVNTPQAAEAGQGFNDDDGNIHETAIEAVSNAGITSGCNPPYATNCCPNRLVTRGEMAAFLVRGLDLPAAPGVDFSDDDDSIFEDSIERLAAAGITRWCNPPANTKYCPSDTVTRAQMAAFLVRALGLTERDSSIHFSDDDDSVFEADIERLATAGITRGCNPPDNTKFCPHARLTRAEMATFLTRVLDLPTSAPASFSIEDMTGDYWVRFIIHAGTASDRRVCAQFHTLYVSVYDKAGNEKFGVGFKADYGAAFSTGDTGDQVLTPTDCGYSMPALVNQVDSQQRRRLNVGAGSSNYESWDSREETPEVLNLGMVQFDHGFDIRNPMSHCTSIVCNSVVVREPEHENATRRTLLMASWRSDFEFDADHALGSGEYYTDAYAANTLAASDPLGTRQFVEPGFHLAFEKNPTASRIECSAEDPWIFAYTCYQLGGAGNLEHLPNPPDMNLEYSLWRN